MKIQKEKSKYWCGTLVSVTEETSKQDKITLVYRIVIATIAFLIGFSFLVVGLKLYTSLNSVKNKKPSAKDEQMKRKLIEMTTIISISFIGQSIIFLVLEILNTGTLLISVPLLFFVEVLPIAFLLYSLRNRANDDHSKKRTTSKPKTKVPPSSSSTTSNLD